jgi:hypothetical protein
VRGIWLTASAASLIEKRFAALILAACQLLHDPASGSSLCRSFHHSLPAMWSAYQRGLPEVLIVMRFPVRGSRMVMGQSFSVQAWEERRMSDGGQVRW